MQFFFKQPLLCSFFLEMQLIWSHNFSRVLCYSALSGSDSKDDKNFAGLVPAKIAKERSLARK